ncbi:MULTISPECIES: helix-turn-helix domain-containing protein [unclassified Streptomyces]|uniref:helix-turn-helix domain-containing protein n=1 Tax=unclassified Streptomyces TaxID=2593676 RepID=UPI002E2DA3A6|nr:helix-turn-helix transcriptional regulator [Streptomyces sp. NBC_00223]
MPLPENVRNYRRRAGLTQEELADAAGHSVGVVRKIEQGGSARVETLHDLARALGVPTSALFETAAPEPVRAREGDTVRLAELRKALMPPVGLVDIFVEPIPVDLIALQRHIDDAHALYHVDRYDSVARTLPGILRESESAVAISDPGSRTRRKALAVRAGALLVTGKYLTQVRRYDLAYHALSRGIVDAREAEQTLTAATGVVGLSWLLLRQDRFDEAESLAASTAAEIEPRMSQATPGQLAAWGELCQRVASAALRNNRPEVAKDARRMAATAASALDMEHVNFREHWTTFGPATAEAKAIEDLSLAGDARGVLRRADDGPVNARALKRLGRPSPNNWFRHRLDVAKAHATLGSHQDAIDELVVIKAQAPEWLSHQRMAGYIVRDVLSKRKRTLTREMRDMASHLDVSG